MAPGATVCWRAPTRLRRRGAVLPIPRLRIVGGRAALHVGLGRTAVRAVGIRVWIIGGLAQRVVELLLVQAGSVEGIASTTVRQGEPGGDPHIRGLDRRPALPGGVRDGGAGGDDVGAHAVDVERGAHGGDLQKRSVRQNDGLEQLARHDDLGGKRGLVLGEACRELGRSGVEGEAAPDDLRPRVRLARRGDLDGEPEAVEQLRAQLALLGVHRADQQEPGRVAYRDALAFDVAGAERGRVEQQVDEVVVQQVDLVDVEHAAVGGREQTRLEGLHALGQRPLDVERADEPVLGGTDRQLDQPGRSLSGGRAGSAGRRGRPGRRAPGRRRTGSR